MENEFPNGDSRRRLVEIIIASHPGSFAFITNKSLERLFSYVSSTTCQQYGLTEQKLFDLIIEGLDGKVDEVSDAPLSIATACGDIGLACYIFKVGDLEGLTDNIAIICRDIEMERVAKIRDQEIDDLFYSGIEMNSDLICIHEQGVLYYANQSTCLFLGAKDLNQLFGHHYSEFLQVDEVTEQLLIPGEINNIKLVAKNGRTFLGCAFIVPIYFQERPMIMVRIRDNSAQVGQQINNQQIQERELRQQKRDAMAALAGGVADDFNKLLSGVIGNASILMASLFDDDPLRELVSRIEKGARQAADLAKQLLLYTASTEIELAPIYLKNIIKDIPLLIQSAIPDRVKLEVCCQEESKIFGDRLQLYQVIMNLLLSSARAVSMTGRNDGKITITTKVQHILPDQQQLDYSEKPISPGQYVVLEITDNGPDIDQQNISKMFSSLYAAKGARSSGLASLLPIIHSHNGYIRVTSNRGQSVTISLYFPETEKSAVTMELESPAGDLKSRGQIVLVIDEDQSIIDVDTMAFELIGYQVDKADNGETGLEAIKNNRTLYSAVIVDYAIPGKNGNELLSAIKEIDPKLPIILTSTYNKEQIVSNLTVQIAGYLQKPYSALTIAQVIEKIRREG